MEKSIIIGNEYDSELISRLKAVILSMEGVQTEGYSGLAGSQEVNLWKFKVNGRNNHRDRNLHWSISDWRI